MVRPSCHHSPSSHAAPIREAGEALRASPRRRRLPASTLAVGLGAGVVLFADLLVVAGGSRPAPYEVVVAAVVPRVPTELVVVPVSETVDRPLPVSETIDRPPPAPAPLAPAAPAPRHHRRGVASWFGAPKGTCAHRTIPKGTIVTVTRAGSDATVTCRVADWGPADTSRVIDLSRDTFVALARAEVGLIDVHIRW